LRKRKNLFEKIDSEIKMPPILNVQIWDNDSFSTDDFLGTLTINLSHFPKPAVSHEKCVIRKAKEYENLFALNQSIRGWFPVLGKINGNEAIKQTVSYIQC
jgi:Ca2+-dependent lipid-binding protein